MNDQDLGQIELKYIDKMNARSGGIIIEVITLVILAGTLILNISWLSMVFGFLSVFWAIMIVIIHLEVKDLNKQIKLKLGIK